MLADLITADTREPILVASFDGQEIVRGALKVRNGGGIIFEVDRDAPRAQVATPERPPPVGVIYEAETLKELRVYSDTGESRSLGHLVVRPGGGVLFEVVADPEVTPEASAVADQLAAREQARAEGTDARRVARRKAAPAA